MADDVGGDGGGAEVRLDLDTSPFDAALDRAAKSASGWGERIQGVFSRASEGITSKTAAVTGFVQTAIDAAGETGDLGESIGKGLGTLIGGVAGFGPIGAAIGRTIGGALGSELGKAVDLQSLTDQVLGAGTEIGGIIEQTSTSWDRVKEAGGETFDRIR